ncbi:unnamed protein product, partial [Iphiclides podalirius]
MKIVYRAMRLLVLVVVFRNVLCKDEFLNQNNVYMKELTSNEGQGSAINSYNSNVIPNNANSQSISSPEAEEEEASKQSENVNLHDSDYGASNQYAGVKYSRSQEEEESLVPITDSTHTHQIGAVIEQDDVPNENREASDSDVAAILLSSSNAGILHDHGQSGLSVPPPPPPPLNALPSSSYGAPSSFSPSSFPSGSLPSASFSGNGLIHGDLAAESLESHGAGFGATGDSGAILSAASLPGASAIGAPLGGPLLGPSGGSFGGPLGGPLSGSFVGGDAPPPGARAPVINEIHGLANSNGAPTQYRVRDEPYQVLREVTHRVPQPVPVPVVQNVQVPVPQPYPVQVPVVRNVPVPVVKIQHVKVDRPVPYPVEKIVKVPVERVVEVPVDHPVPVERVVEVPIVKLVKVPVHVVKTYPVPVVKTVHHKAHISHHHEHGHGHGWSLW